MSSNKKIEAVINIDGRVQGVGFRPFIYRKAVKNGLTGYVINLGDAGVEVVIEGDERAIEKFIQEVEEDSPDVSEIEKITFKKKAYKDRFHEFKIDKSQSRGKVASGIFPPDIGICDKCLNDMFDSETRWYHYPFTACASCGPRFSGIKALPYDRERTHMHEFPMCNYCQEDYYDPLDRRFDAQGTTCSVCGPKMFLYDRNGSMIEVKDVFAEAAKILSEENVIAIKGIGGIHLSSLATVDEIIEKFRARKNRPYQPFAIMSPNLETVRRYAYVDRVEEKVLTSWRKPIVLLKKKNKIISEIVAPRLHRVGVMLPYTGIQVMLFEKINEPALIMTSGNKPGLPMSINNKESFKELEGLADYFLLHNRKIVNRIDDSVLRIINGRKAFTRRSRGYVPDPIEIPISKGIALAVGAELRNSAVITNNGKAFTTQYLGDINNLEGLEFEKNAIKNLRDLLNITCNFDVIACDLHPQYMTSQYAEVISQENDIPLVKSQHHHAHIISVAAENLVPKDEEILGIALDGAGYGSDGTIWGGEILKSSYSRFERLGNLEVLPMPGGDLCAIYPYRMLIAAISNEIKDEVIRDITKNHIEKGLPHGVNELDIILKQARRSNVMKTSSAGRFLDSIAALIGLTYRRTYEGEPAMKLEALATRGDPNSIQIDPIISKDNGKYTLKTSEILYKILENRNKYKNEDIAAFGQKYLAKGITEIAVKIYEETGVEKIGLSGGVLVNGCINRFISKIMEKEGLSVLYQKKVPPGDGGTALGQTIRALYCVI